LPELKKSNNNFAGFESLGGINSTPFENHEKGDDEGEGEGEVMV
jgi:hypothetical protein